MDDLTKLSGLELVARARMIDGLGLPCGWRPECVEELARRAEEDTRVWQRNLERERDELRASAEFAERELSDAFGLPPAIGPSAGEAKRVVDGLREQCESWKRKALATQAQIDRDDSIAMGQSTAELVNDLARMREKRDTLQAHCDAQRKELHSLNVERAKTLTKLEDAQKRIAELEAELVVWKANDAQARRDWNADKACASQVIDVFRDLTEMHTPQEAAEDVKRKLFDARERIAELDMELGQERTLSRVLSERIRLAREWLASVDPPWPHAHIDEIARSAARRIAELEAQMREAQNAGADEWTADGEAVPEPATVVSTAELTPFEIAAANACDAMHVDADGLGFVKRGWLDRHRANVRKQRHAMDEPAIDADEPITSWSIGKVLHALDRHVSAEALDTMAAKCLRELMTKLDAVTGLAQRWEHQHLGTLVGADFEAASARCARELREVLNGKR